MIKKISFIFLFLLFFSNIIYADFNAYMECRALCRVQGDMIYKKCIEQTWDKKGCENLKEGYIEACYQKCESKK